MSSNHRPGRLGFLAPAALSMLWFVGCGDGSSLPVGDSTGRIAVNVDWPAPGSPRLIPANTVSVKIDINGNTPGLSVADAQIITTGANSANFPGLLPGTYTVAAGAYPNANALGQALAAGNDTNVVVTANNTTTVNLVLDSQVVSVTVGLSPSITVDLATATSTATLTGWNGAGGTGAMVMIDPSKVTWVSDTPAAATVPGAAGNGVTVTPVTGGASGGTRQVRITGRYLELPVDLSGSSLLQIDHTGGTGVVDVNVSR